MSIFLLVIGLGLIVAGRGALLEGAGAGRQPEQVELTRLEAGDLPMSPYVQIGPHLLRYDTIVTSSQGKSIVYYVPIVSDELFHEPGGNGRSRFTVLLKTGENPLRESLPQVTRCAEVIGMLERSSRLDGPTATQLSELYPFSDPSEVLILNAGRSPLSQTFSWTIMAAGISVVLVGLRYAALRLDHPPEPDPLDKSPLQIQSPTHILKSGDSLLP